MLRRAGGDDLAGEREHDTDGHRRSPPAIRALAAVALATFVGSSCVVSEVRKTSKSKACIASVASRHEASRTCRLCCGGADGHAHPEALCAAAGLGQPRYRAAPLRAEGAQGPCREPGSAGAPRPLPPRSESG